ncbi:MAG: AAA family ATPase, partial [Candidatus Cloacimonetes bacterium]|nr:AAA family ATPase [Candidatus Cloacimonadota bacterium]
KLKNLEKTRDEIKELWEKTKGTEQPEVTLEDVAQVLSKITGIPVSKLTEEEKKKLLNLEKELHKRIVGQDEAVKLVSEAIRRARAGLKDKRRPIGSFMFLGPTGVGKTELTRALAEVLYGSEEAMIRLDMSEYQERHTVARLIGSPPGYVGFEEGGQLTEKVRRQPFSIILLDEIEKAHLDVFNLLLQIFEDGRLTDGKGRTVDFKNTILIMTSNLGGKLIQKAQSEKKSQEELEEELEKLLKATFRPEFLNRIDEFVVFKALSKKEILQIVDLLLEETKRLASGQNIELKIEKKVKEFLVEEGFDPQFGARPLRRVIQREIETPLSEKLIAGTFGQGDKIMVKLGEKGNLEFTNRHSGASPPKSATGGLLPE